MHFGLSAMKKKPFICLISLVLLCGSVKAQFAKALPQSNPSASTSEATYNVGIIGGLNVTHWFDWGGPFTKYEQPIFLFDQNAIVPSLLNHGLAGIVVERKLGENNSIGIEALYANRWTDLTFEYMYPNESDQEQSDRSIQIFHQNDSILYHEIDIQVPLTHYFLGADSKIRPYVFVAPRFSLPFSGNRYWKKYQVDSEGNHTFGKTDFNIDTIPSQFMRPWNIGAVAGAGMQFRFDIGGYYMLLKLDASCHFGILKEPALADQRHIGNATAKFTLLFPLKKIEKGACLNWGEYD